MGMDIKRDAMEKWGRPLAYAVAVGSLAFAGCSSDGSRETAPPATTTTEHPTTTTSNGGEALIPPVRDEGEGACIIPEIAVDPYGRLNEDNINDVQSQLDALWAARNPEAEITFRNVINAGAIIYNSFRDNAYAEAFMWARTAELGPITAESLLNRSYNIEGDCLSWEQIEQVDALYDTLIDGMAPKVGEQMSAAAREAYENLKNEYQRFKREYFGVSG